jgi:hypothetical protein
MLLIYCSHLDIVQLRVVELVFQVVYQAVEAARASAFFRLGSSHGYNATRKRIRFVISVAGK